MSTTNAPASPAQGAPESPTGSVHGEAMDAMLAAVAREEASQNSESGSEHEQDEAGNEANVDEGRAHQQTADGAALAPAPALSVPAAPVMPFVPVPTVAMASVQPPHHSLPMPMKQEPMPVSMDGKGGVPFSRLTNEPPRLVFHSTRTSDNSLESVRMQQAARARACTHFCKHTASPHPPLSVQTRRLLLRVQLSDAAVYFLNSYVPSCWNVRLRNACTTLTCL